MCVAHQIADLKAALPMLPAGRADFASSLIAQATKGKKPLSPKQVDWVGKLIALATTPKAQPEGISVASDFSGVLALFATATGNGMKKPTIRLAVLGLKFTLSLAPAAGKNAGYVYLKVDGEYRGKISPEGKIFPYELADDQREAVFRLLGALAADPAGVALDYGKATGTCCFCAKDLTDERSVFAGYGPQCAEHYGLPWGADQ